MTPAYQRLVAQHERVRLKYLEWSKKPPTPVTIELLELFNDVMALIETQMKKERDIEAPGVH